MGEDKPGLFVVCALDDIAPGTARPFTLSRAGEADAGRPFPIFIVRVSDDVCVGYVNACPHDGVWLNVGDGEFFSADGAFLRCGRHGATFDILSGLCVDGPCAARSLEAVPLLVSDGEVCVYGIDLVEEDRHRDPFLDFDPDETMEIMIHPD
jgi:nitrite reductase/ring-hydroxylating ferredoxin subunit